METLEQLEKKINDMVEKKHQEITKVQAKLDKTIATIDKAKKDLATAKETIDGDTYVKAKLTLEKATAEKELYSGVLDDMKNKALIPDNEYKQLVSAIKKRADSLNDDLVKQGQTVLPQLKKLNDQARKIQTTAEGLLDTVVCELSGTPEDKVYLNRDKDYIYGKERGQEKATMFHRYEEIEWELTK